MYRKPFIYALAAAALLSSTAAQAALAPVPVQAAASQTAGLERTTFEYAIKGGQKLYLDRIVDKNAKIEGKRPVVIYSFGGGWETGQRVDGGSRPFLEYLASLGYVVVAIDYRLAIKEAKAKGELTPATWLDTYLRAIDWGVEDLFDATAYVLRNADAWNIDKDQIVALGSSAGATNSLVGEYNVANATPLAQAHLPAGFRYAGIVAMAGAFWLKGADTPLAFKSKPAPIMFFHGPKDQLVTYDETHDAFAGYGPAYYTRVFAGPDYPKWFVDVVEGDHIMAMAPMFDYRYEIAAFLQKLVRERQQLSIHSVEKAKVPKTFQNLLTLYGDEIKAAAKEAAPTP